MDHEQSVVFAFEDAMFGGTRTASRFPLHSTFLHKFVGFRSRVAQMTFRGSENLWSLDFKDLYNVATVRMDG